MSITLKRGNLKYKNPATGEYEGVDVVAETATATQVADIQAEGATQIAAVEAKGVATRASIPNDYTTLSDDVDDLKSAVTEIESEIGGLDGGAIGQVLRKKSNTDYDIEWASVAAPTDAQVETAVTDWLDDHPEAVTTVEDGSITAAKINNSFLPEIENDYVTPEMFGAVGDGTTDDTQALQDMFDAGKDVHFPNKAYATSGVAISSVINIQFDNTTLNATTDYQDYVLSISARITMTGKLYVNGKYRALNGIKFASGSGGSMVDYIDVRNMRAWGVHISSGHNTFGYIYTMECGTRIQLTITKVSDYIASISSTVSASNKILLQSPYVSNMFALADDTVSGVDLPGPYMRKVAGYDDANNTLSFVESTQNRLPNAISETPFSVCYGGGVFVAFGVNSQIDFGIIDTRLGPNGIGLGSTYGHHIRSFYSQSDRIPIAIYDYGLGNYIGSITAEGSKSGYVILSYYYDYSVIGTRSTGYSDNYISSEICSQVNSSSARSNALHLKALRNRVMPTYYEGGEMHYMSDQSPSITMFGSRNAFKIELHDMYQTPRSYNIWGVKTVYFLPNSMPSNDITITLVDDLISAGYSIYGGTNGVLTFARPSQWFKAEIILTSNKVFTVCLTELVRQQNNPTST